MNALQLPQSRISSPFDYGYRTQRRPVFQVRFDHED
jgi:hypothetical protein